MMRTVYFFVSPSCGACEEWKPVVDAFITKHLGKVLALRCNPNFRDYTFGRWSVKYTPSVAVQESGHLLRYAEGRLMTLEELEDFVFSDPAEPEPADEEEEEEEEEDD